MVKFCLKLFGIVALCDAFVYKFPMVETIGYEIGRRYATGS